MLREYDQIIIGAGIYGLYAAQKAGLKGKKVLVLEFDSQPFSRATYINQARIHNGYHYPRSYSTATKSAGYFRRFCEDFQFAVVDKYQKIYAIAKNFSWTSAQQFKQFCANAHIKCDEIVPTNILRTGAIAAAFETEEYTFDALKIRDYFVEKIGVIAGVTCLYNVRIKGIENDGKRFVIDLGEQQVAADVVLNATYASTNQILDLFGFEHFKIKYEICEIILCSPCEALRHKGITVMDGPFFSVMPFGDGTKHSLTSVTFTPHKTSQESLPRFDCQAGANCTPQQLDNCNTCINRPASAWAYMSSLAKKYLAPGIDLSYDQSLYAIKPILKSSEIDDSRPTVIRKFSDQPQFYSVLSGKINTIYDLDTIL